MSGIWGYRETWPPRSPRYVPLINGVHRVQIANTPLQYRLIMARHKHVVDDTWPRNGAVENVHDGLVSMAKALLDDLRCWSAGQANGSGKKRIMVGGLLTR